MHRIIEEQHVVALIVKEMTGTISEKEKNELENWLAVSEENRNAYEELKRINIAKEWEHYQQLDAHRGWKRYKETYPTANRKIVPFRLKIAVVAAILLTVGIGGMMQHYNRTERKEVAGKPGTSKAVLIMSDGSVKNLTTHPEKEVLNNGNLTIRNEGNSLRYEKKEQSEDKAEDNAIHYNELHIPRGGEYQLILADGTKVWLNSQTVLRYPMEFKGGERKVSLEGEAYFEVARDKKQPFRVEVRGDVKVEVLGTSFNVRAYADEETVETVLEKGSVRMWRKAENRILAPGMRAVCNKAEIKVDSVQTELYTAWRMGQYVFREETIENILQRLSRWYSVEIFYADEEAKHLVFSGSVKKYETIRNLLNAIELAGGVHFEISGNTVVVSSRNKN